MTRFGYIVFALLVTLFTTLINIDTRGGSGGSSRSWGKIGRASCRERV